MENLTIAAVAGAAGCWIAKWCVHQWDVATFSTYQVLDYIVDFRTFWYPAAITLGAAILFSFAPAARVMQIGVNGVLKGDAQGVTQRLRGKRFAAGLIAGQMALAIVLLSGAGVLVRSLASIVNAKTGTHDPEHVRVGSARLPSDKYPGIETRNSYLERLESRLREIQQSSCPFANQQAFEIEVRPVAPDDRGTLGFFGIGSNYFGVASDLQRRDAASGCGDHPGSCGIAGRKSRLAVAIGWRLALRSSDARVGSSDSDCGGVARLRDSSAARDERRSGHRASARLSYSPERPNNNPNGGGPQSGSSRSSVRLRADHAPLGQSIRPRTFSRAPADTGRSAPDPAQLARTQLA